MPVSPTLNDLYCVASYGPLVAFAAGKKSTIIMTRDGGNTWTSLSATLQSGTGIGTSVVFAFHAISMLSPAVMYISGSNGAIIKTGKYYVVRYISIHIPINFLYDNLLTFISYLLSSFLLFFILFD